MKKIERQKTKQKENTLILVNLIWEGAEFKSFQAYNSSLEQKKLVSIEDLLQ